MRTSQAHIAGIGITTNSGNGGLDRTAISAATKALLDAGVTYSDVDASIACFQDDLRLPRSCFDIFGMEGASVHEMDNHSGLLSAVHSVQSTRSNCVLLVGVDQAASSSSTKTEMLVVGIVLVSDLFLTSHAYLKDGAVCIRGASLTHSIHSRASSGPNKSRTYKTAVDAALRQAQLGTKDIQVLEEVGQSQNQKSLGELGFKQQDPVKAPTVLTGSTGLAGLCGLVWQLRGWAGDSKSEVNNCLQFSIDKHGAARVLVLSRSDGRPALTWSEIQNVRDGRERLGYNPAVEVRDVSQEDLADVKARTEFTRDDNSVKRLELPLKGGDRAALARL